MSDHNDAILDMYGPEQDGPPAMPGSDAPSFEPESPSNKSTDAAPHSRTHRKRRSIIDDLHDSPEPIPEPAPEPKAGSRSNSNLEEIQRRLSALNVSRSSPGPAGTPRRPQGPRPRLGSDAPSTPSPYMAKRTPRRYNEDGSQLSYLGHDSSHLSSRMSVSSRVSQRSPKSSESASMRSYSRQSLSRQTAAEQTLMQALDDAREATDPSILMSLLERVVVDMIGVHTAADDPDVVAAADRASLSLADFISRFAHERA